MSSKNVRIVWGRSQSRTFQVVVRLCLAVALLQVIAAIFLLAPAWVGHLVSQFANNEKMEPVFSPEKMLLPTPVEKATPAQKRILKEPIALLEKETIEKTISSGMESGLQVGEALSLVSIQHLPGSQGEHTLKIAMKSRMHESIAISEVKVQVYFYDQVEGEIVASKSPVTSHWLNPAVDWSRGNPQLLEVTYEPDNNNPDTHYLGYVVAVYYRGELQAYRADPPSITNRFPIKVYIGQEDF